VSAKSAESGRVEQARAKQARAKPARARARSAEPGSAKRGRTEPPGLAIEAPPAGAGAADADSLAALRVAPGTPVDLDAHDPRATLGFRDKTWARRRLGREVVQIAALQERLWAEHRRALLVVLQAPDAGGKDGTTRAVFSGVNPQGCHVTAFKVPSAVEREHDFLWRVHHAVPGAGRIGIFNRSHYEDVLVVRVDELVAESVWRARYEQINAFEAHLAANGVTTLKLYLNVSYEEQAERLRERLTDPAKRWKFSPDDLRKRGQWGDYRRAYEEALTRCSTEHAPWYVVPGDRNWVRNLAVARLVRQALEAMDPQVPAPEWNPESVVIE
jgi:PPK2 family polyphosphate:nucleotide phosphotransferase